MDFKTIPFSHLSYDPSLVRVTVADFQSIIDEEFFHFDESAEAEALMSDEDRQAVAKFDETYH